MRKQTLAIIGAAAGAAGALWAADGTWTAGAGGDWSGTGNWQSGAVASGSGSTAYLGSGSGTINNDVADLALLGLQFAGGGYTLAGNTLALDAAGFLTVLAGTHTVSAPLTLNGATAVNVASGQRLDLNGLLSGAGGLTVKGGRVVLGNADNSYLGATVVITGLVETASVDAFGDSSADPANLVLGDGTLRYTGPSATLSRGFTVAPTNFGNRAAALDVTNAGATLTVSGKIAVPNGCFIKAGPGTLALTYPGDQQLSRSRLTVNEGANLAFDANGSASTNGYALFTVADGKVVLGAAGQTNNIVGVAWVGARSNTSPRMEVLGGVTKVTGSYFTIGRGTGTPPYIARPSLYIGNNAYMEMGSFVMANNNGVGGNFRCAPELALTNGTLVVFGDCFLGEYFTATSTVTVANNSLFRNDSTGVMRGMILGFAGPAKTDVIFDGSSTGRVYTARLARLTSMTVQGGSVFEMDSTPTNALLPEATDFNTGRVFFNGGTLAPRTPKLASDWFGGMTNLFVGANNLTLSASSHAWLAPQTRADPASAGGKIVKTGTGSVALRPTALNVDLGAGRRALPGESPQVTNVTRGVVTASADTTVELSASGAAGGMALSLGSTPLTLTPHSLISNPDLWRYNERAMRRADGVLQLTPEMANLQNQKGSAFLRARQSVGGAWTATFNYICWGTQSNPADGASFIIHNDPRGAAACGGSGGSLGYADTGTIKITNSVAVGIAAYNHILRFGRQGAFTVANTLPAALPSLCATPVKTKFVVSYDGAGLLAVELTRPGSLTYRYTWSVNLPAEVGAGEAFVGFAGGTGGGYGQQSITDFQFVNGLTAVPSLCRYGGNVTLAPGATLSTVSTPTAQQRGFVLGALSYGDQAVVKADSAAVASSATPAPTLSEQGMWKLNQYANWKADGRLAVSQNANNTPGTAFTTNLYPISGSWTARFNYDMGLHSIPPADYINFIVQSGSTNSTVHAPSPGFAIQWRYYMGGTNSTMVRMYLKGVETLGSTNIAPVSLFHNPLATMTVAYNNSAKTVTVITEQTAGAYTNVFNGVDMGAAVGSTTAYLGFGAFTGGLNAENIVSDFSFVAPGVASSANVAGYVGFDKLGGTGTLVKRGSAALGLLGDIDRPTSNNAVRLEQGGLVLRKSNLEPLLATGARSEWVFTPEGKWGDDSALQFCVVGVENSVGSATSARRVRVKEPFTIAYNFLFGARPTAPADAYALFFHNDPRGPGAVGGPTMGAGYSGITPSLGLRWYFYPNNGTALTNTVAFGRAGAWDEGSRQSHMPIALVNGVTGHIITYDPAAATLTSVMTQGVYAVTNVFTGVNIPADVGSDYAYVGFSGGCGGLQGELRIRDFSMTYGAPLADTVADQSYLAGLDLPGAASGTVTLDSTVLGGTYRLASATVGDGATLAVDAAAQPGTLAVGAVAQSGDATYAPASGCTLALTDVAGGGALTQAGAGTLALAGAAATYDGDTVLAAGTLALDAARLPTGTDLRVTTGATLNLAFTGNQRIHALIVDGVMQRGGRYTSANTPWITGDGVLVVTFPPVGSLIKIQ